MQINQYQQILLKCEYINGICDSLLKQLQKQNLSKSFLKSKLFNDQKNSPKTYIDQLELLKDKNSYVIRQKQIEVQKERSYHIINNIKQQINQLNINKVSLSINNRQTTKFIKQISEIQFEISQGQRLLNCQMQNLTFLKTNNIQINQALIKYDKRQSQIKHKINKIKQSSKQCLQLKHLQQKYDNLIDRRKFLLQQTSLIEKNMHLKVINKIQAIIQSSQNLQEMQNYQKQLKYKIKQQQFIIDQIQNRQIQSLNKLSGNKQSIDDSKIFEDQVSNLRKTIANRKFKKKMHTQKKMDMFHNNPTPKNKPKPKQIKSQSIFKIQYQPFNLPNKPNNVDSIKNKNSRVNSVNQNSVNSQYQQITNSRFISNNFSTDEVKKIKNNARNSQKDFNTLQIQALQKILNKKEQEIQDQLKNNNIENQAQNKSSASHKIMPIKLRSRTEFTRQKSINKSQRVQKDRRKNFYTQPVLPKQKNPQIKTAKNYLQANSRFIDQIIQNDDQNINRLKNNIRIRTKKSQSQRYNQMIKSRNLSRQFNAKRNSQLVKPTQQSKQKNKSPKSQKKNVSNRTTNNKPLKKQNNAFFVQQDGQSQNQFANITLQNSTIKPITLKYKQKVSTRSEFKKDKKQVIQKIEQIQNYKELNNNQLETKQNCDSKISIFKLQPKRRNGNLQAFLRKGKPQSVQLQNTDSNQSDIELSKIQQQDQSIRKTKQSILIQ